MAGALSLAGCGAAARPQEPEPLTAQEREVADGYRDLMRAFTAGRYREFCNGLTDESLKLTARNLMGVEMTCPEWAEENAQILGDDLRAQADALRVDRVEIDGDEATLDWTADDGDVRFEGSVEAERAGQRWKYTAITPER